MPDEHGRMEILLEDIQSKVDVLVEGHTALREGQDALREGQQEIAKRLDTLETRETQHYLELKGEIGRVETELKNDIAGLGKRVTRLEKKVDRLVESVGDKLADHDKRLRKLERRRPAA